MVSAAPVWFTMLVQFVVAMVATISFGITFQVGRRHYWTCGFVGAVGYYFLRNDRALCTSKGIETLKVAVALALGIAIVCSIPLPKRHAASRQAK